MKRIALLLLGCLSLGLLASPSRADDPKVRPERPRLFLRAKAWDGPSVEAIRKFVDQDEYRKRIEHPYKLRSRTTGQGLLYLITGDKALGAKAVEGLKEYRISGSSPSYSGIEAQKMAALYDWLHDHPDFDEASRAACRAHMEKWADQQMSSLAAGGPSTPFYSRVSGAIAGLTAIGLSLHGDSPKAEKYVKFSADYLKTKIGTIRQVEDGATGGGSYGLHHEFTDLANMVAAWRSATDWDAGQWIAQNQGDWLRRQLRYQIWMTYPNGWFIKDGDIWSGSHTDKTQFGMAVAAATSVTRSGFGRTWLNTLYKRWGLNDFHGEFVWEWLVFNDPTIAPRPLSELGRAEVFSSNLHGWVCWRSGWDEDATIVHFKCGESVDHHGTYDQGKFYIYKRAPLAIKNGAYIGYKTPHHMYFKSPWSANCVVFTGEKWDGMQPFIDFDGTPSWSEWKAERDKKFKRPPTGVLTATESNEQFARAAGDLSGSCPPNTAWTREMVFLGYKYVLVLDRVDAGQGIDHRWTLHTVNQPKLDGNLAVADNGQGRLFCKTLLPADARLTLVGGEGHEFDYNGQNRPPKGWKGLDKEGKEMQYGGWRLDVQPVDGARQSVYLHVLYPADASVEKMPECSVSQAGDQITVKVGELSHTFKK